MRRTTFVCAAMLACGVVMHAQVAVFDAAVTGRNTATAATKEHLLALQRQQHSELRRMAQRLSMFTDLGKFRRPDAPRWRTHAWEANGGFRFASEYLAAMTYGDPEGVAYLSLVEPISEAASSLQRLPHRARQAMSAQLATVHLSDAIAIAGTHDSGRLRYNGRRELTAIDGLERDVTNGSLEQSATAVLDKISGAVLIAARQRQARVHLLSSVVEQLLVDSKRARDSEASAVNMQIVAWRDGEGANRAFVAGAGDALRAWRQP